MSGRRRFCAKPFRHLEIVAGGDAYLCCSDWLPLTVGNVRREPAARLWNGAIAQGIRRSILDDSFRWCTGCPHLATVSHSVRWADEVDEPALRSLMRDGVTTQPEIGVLNLAYDRTCNLSCPSCRTDVIVAHGAEYQRLEDLQAQLLAGDLLSRVRLLYLTGSGDPFASRLFRELARSLEPARYPRLRLRLHTNAQLFTAAAWEALGPARALVREVEVSIDGASAATYHENRRGGSWETLLDNLGFVARLRAAGALQLLQISFVVQANNWREMGAFVDLGDRLSVDQVYFSELRNWGTFSPDEHAARAVHFSGHPEHASFREALASDPRLHRAHVVLGALAG